ARGRGRGRVRPGDGGRAEGFGQPVLADYGGPGAGLPRRPAHLHQQERRRGGSSMNFVANREVRWIPKGWQHPKDGHGRCIPLLDRRYWDELARELGADSPLISRPMPEVRPGDEVEIAAYEITTEGTPVSPAFPDTPLGRLALVNYCA